MLSKLRESPQKASLIRRMLLQQPWHSTVLHILACFRQRKFRCYSIRKEKLLNSKKITFKQHFSYTNSWRSFLCLVADNNQKYVFTEARKCSTIHRNAACTEWNTKFSSVKHIFNFTCIVALVFSKFHPWKPMAFISFLYWYKQQQLWIFPLLSKD